MLKKEKGITLIALIITIIVMLILVGVTINVALNGGLFSKAENAATQTNIAVIREQLQDLILGKANNNLEIEADLGTIKLEGEEYTVTAIEVGGRIKINLTRKGETEPEYIYDLENDIKMSGIAIKNDKIEIDNPWVKKGLAADIAVWNIEYTCNAEGSGNYFCINDDGTMEFPEGNPITVEMAEQYPDNFEIFNGGTILAIYAEEWYVFDFENATTSELIIYEYEDLDSYKNGQSPEAEYTFKSGATLTYETYGIQDSYCVITPEDKFYCILGQHGVVFLTGVVEHNKKYNTILDGKYSNYTNETTVLNTEDELSLIMVDGEMLGCISNGRVYLFDIQSLSKNIIEVSDEYQSNEDIEVDESLLT